MAFLAALNSLGAAITITAMLVLLVACGESFIVASLLVGVVTTCLVLIIDAPTLTVRIVVTGACMRHVEASEGESIDATRVTGWAVAGGVAPAVVWIFYFTVDGAAHGGAYDVHFGGTAALGPCIITLTWTVSSVPAAFLVRQTVTVGLARTNILRFPYANMANATIHTEWTAVLR